MGILLVKQLVILLFYAVIGYAAVKGKLLKASDSNGFSTLIVYICIPCVVIKSLQIELNQENMHGFLVSVVFIILIHIIWINLTKYLKEPLRLTPVEQATLIYSNSGNMVIPLVAALFGEQYVFYACLYNAVQQIFIWTHGVCVIQEEKKNSWKRLLGNTSILSIIVGVIFLFGGIKLPQMALDILSGFGNMVGPLSMLVIGMSIAEADLKAVFRNVRSYGICVGRLVGYPMIIMGLLCISGYLRFFPEDKSIFQIAMLAVTAPPAGIITQLRIMCHKDGSNAGIYNIMSVLACIITMPVMMTLFQMLF